MLLFVYLVLGAVFSYLIGSIPFGVIVAKLFRLPDLRTIGSGNIGATNVLRTGNKIAAALTLALDIAKGTAVILVTQRVLDQTIKDLYFLSGDLDRELMAEMISGPVMAAIIMMYGVCAVLGHLYPVWLKFKGGKGVATYLGVLLGFAPLAGLVAIATWLAVAAIFRYSSLAALVAIFVGALTIGGIQFSAWANLIQGSGTWVQIIPTVMALILATLVASRHHENIRRLLKGTESKIGQSAS